MKTFFISLALTFIGLPALAIPLSRVDQAAGAAGFDESKMIEAKAPFSVRKTGKDKTFSILSAYPSDAKVSKGEATTPIAQLTLNCNQCARKKLGEAFAFACYEDVQAIARDLKIDLPGGIVRQFETFKTPQENWPSTDKKAKGFRFSKTIFKCDRHLSAESIRFDFFFY